MTITVLCIDRDLHPLGCLVIADLELMCVYYSAAGDLYI
jgi:hypothetical protein